MEHHDVVVDGVRLHVVTAGDPEAPPIVLLHGWPQTWWCWNQVIPRLTDTHRVIVPDLRGFGASEAPPGRYEKETLARDVLGVLDALGVERAIVVGHDWGGFVAWLVALLAPERTERLVVLSMIHPWFSVERSPRALLDYWYQLPIMTPGLNRLLMPQVGRIIRRAGAAPWSAEDARRYGAPYRSAAHVRAAANLYRSFPLREVGSWEDERASFPVTVATGTEDPVIKPARIRGVRADDLRIEILDGAGHFIPEERPAEVADLILHR